MKRGRLKRGIITAVIGGICAISAVGCASKTAETTATTEQTTSETTASVAGTTKNNSTVSTPELALQALKDGNKQFLDGTITSNVSLATRTDLADNGQKPYAVVIACSDSRVSPELVFNSNLGEVFVIRTAGNVVGDYEVGSVEYAVDHLGAPLVLVMGHTQCGAVGGAIEGHATGHVEDIIKEIEPSVTKAKEQTSDSAQIADIAENLNVENTKSKLMESGIIKGLVDSGKVQVKGCKYNIKDGTISYF